MFAITIDARQAGAEDFYRAFRGLPPLTQAERNFRLDRREAFAAIEREETLDYRARRDATPPDGTAEGLKAALDDIDATHRRIEERKGAWAEENRP
jgi:hypothetical protein